MTPPADLRAALDRLDGVLPVSLTANASLTLYIEDANGTRLASAGTTANSGDLGIARAIRDALNALPALVDENDRLQADVERAVALCQSNGSLISYALGKMGYPPGASVFRAVDEFMVKHTALVALAERVAEGIETYSEPRFEGHYRCPCGAQARERAALRHAEDCPQEIARRILGR